MKTYAILSQVGEILYTITADLPPTFLAEREIPFEEIVLPQGKHYTEFFYNFIEGVFEEKPQKPSPYYFWETSAYKYNISAHKEDLTRNLQNKCSEEILKGFLSFALGSAHLYPCDKQDQANLTASIVDSLNPLNDETWLTPFWCADDEGAWEYKLHTKEQIQKVGADGKAHIVEHLMKNAQLQAQVKSATTEEELIAIVW